MKPRRFQFRLRDLLWLTLLAAVLCGWWVDRGQLSRESYALRRQVDVQKFELILLKELHEPTFYESVLFHKP